MNETVAYFLAAVARRIRVVWGLATFAWIGPAVAAGALALMLLARYRPWTWPEVAALVLVATALVTVTVIAMAMPISQRVSAITADHGLNTKDAFATALEVDTTAEPFGPAIADRAIFGSGRQ